LNIRAIIHIRELHKWPFKIIINSTRTHPLKGETKNNFNFNEKPLNKKC
jgi:hypothetical protein